MSVAPTFEVLSGLASIWRRGLSPDKVVDALKVNSGARSFPNNTMVVNGFTAREGGVALPGRLGQVGVQRVERPHRPPPVAGPQERWDSEGGVTIIQGPWTVKTNMVDLAGLAAGDELCVARSTSRTRPCPRATDSSCSPRLAAISLHTVVAIVEEVGTDYAIITKRRRRLHRGRQPSSP